MPQIFCISLLKFLNYIVFCIFISETKKNPVLNVCCEDFMTIMNPHNLSILMIIFSIKIFFTKNHNFPLFSTHIYAKLKKKTKQLQSTSVDCHSRCRLLMLEFTINCSTPLKKEIHKRENFCI